MAGNRLFAVDFSSLIFFHPNSVLETVFVTETLQETRETCLIICYAILESNGICKPCFADVFGTMSLELYIYIPYTYTSRKRPTACCGSTCSLLSRNILRTPESHPRALQFRLSVKMMRHTHPTDTDTSVDGGFKHGFLCPCLSRNGVYPRQDANCDRELGQIPHHWIWQNTVYQLDSVGTTS